MTRKKQKIGLLDLGRLPVTKIATESTPRFGLKKFQAEEAAREAEIAQRPLREAEAQLTQAAREANSRLKKFWSLPISALQNEFPSECPVDTLMTYPTLTGPIDRAQADAVLWEFQKYLTERGCELSGDGWIRYCRYSLAAVLYDNVEASVATFEKMLHRLVELDAFSPSELIGYENVSPAPQPVTQPSQDTSKIAAQLSETIPTDSPVWKRLVSQGFEGEIARWYFSWIQSLKRNFNYDFPIEKFTMKVADFLQRWNLSPFRYDSYDKVRISFVKQGLFAPHMLTEAERLSLLIEDADLNNFEVRRDIGRRHREILQAGPPIPVHR